MAGVRLFRNTDPNIMRFPQWSNNVLYPAGSFVAVPFVNPADSEDITFRYYASTREISYDNKTNASGAVITEGGSWSPADSDSDWKNHSIYGNNPWSLAFDSTEASLVASIIPQLNALAALYPLIGIDSDIAVLYSNDSDASVLIRNLDSDLRQRYHDALAADSDRDTESTRRLDSEVHERKAADSDLSVRIIDNDSDILMEIHDRKSADSDLKILITNNDSDILQKHHDALAADSERFKTVINLSIRLDNDSERLTEFDKKYQRRDSDIDVKLRNIDSDLDYIYENGIGSSNTGFPVGSVLPFAHMDMPDGFRIADGSPFNEFAYPNLFQKLGSNRLPDLRNKYIVGWNDDSDGANNPAFAKSTDTFNAASGSSKTILSTRLVFGIAMYDGAGIITDSEFLLSLMTIEFADRDSDIRALYNLTSFHTETWAPNVDVAAGTSHIIGVDSVNYTDHTVLLNGVEVYQYAFATNTITLQFPLRANLDVVTIKLRR